MVSMAQPFNVQYSRQTNLCTISKGTDQHHDCDQYTNIDAVQMLSNYELVPKNNT